MQLTVNRRREERLMLDMRGTIIVLAMGLSALVGCGSSSSGPRFNGKTGTTWETLAADSDTSAPGFSDYSPAGKPFIFDLVSTTLQKYNGSWSTLTGPTDDMGDWPGPAWIKDNLYVIRSNNVYAYSISGDSWTTVLSTDVPNTADSQMAHDDSGNVWTVESDSPYRIIKYSPSANTITTYDSGLAATSEARVAWDSATKKLFIGPGYDIPLLYSFDPATTTVEAKASVPAVGGGTGTGMGDPFCSDRSGHLYAIGDTGCDDSASMFQYDTKTDTWKAIPDVPFTDHGCDGACTVSDDGWLYFTDGETGNFSRLPLH
jgi:hypothetical protein